MVEFKQSDKFHKLVDMYRTMAEDGYARSDGGIVTPDQAFSNIEPAKFRQHLLPLFRQHGVKTALDYGSGGGDWEQRLPEGPSLRSYLELDAVHRFEPARSVDQREKADAVLCFDVLEHIFATDVPFVVNELFSLANNLVAVNIAMYPAAALLPNGENAHITLRPAIWWKGVFDTVGALYPDVTYALYLSPEYGKVQFFQPTSAGKVNASHTFCTTDT